MKIEVNDYVRTTYGIGKIENAYVVYDDSGGIWHLCYTTDNPKIEIGIYTKGNSWELFGEVQKDHSIKYEPLNMDTQKYFDMIYSEKLEEPVCYVPVVNGIPRNAELYDDHKFIKSSPNIIDLIEVGDYVNGEKVTDKFDYLLAFGNNDYYKNENEIKNIVTKEQFEEMEYKIGDE